MSTLSRNPVLKNAFLYFGNQVYTRIIQFVIITILASTLTEADYGTYGLIIVLYRFMPLPMSLGFNRAIGRISLDDDNHVASNSVFQLILRLGLLFGVWLLITTYFYDFSLDTELIFSTYLLIFAATFTEFFLSLQRIRERARIVARAQIVGITAQLIFILTLDAYNLSIQNLIYALTISEIILVFSLVSDRPLPIRLVLRKNIIRENLGFSLPFIIYGGAIWIFQIIDRYMIGYYLTLEDVAWYTLAFQLGNLVSWLSQPINQAISPRFDKAFVNRGMKGLNEIHRKVFIFYFIFSILFFLSITLFGFLYLKFVVPTYYDKSLSAFILICIGGMFRILYLPFINIIKALKETKKVSVLSVILIFINFLLNILLIPFLGIEGAAISTLISQFLLLVVYYYIVRRMGIKTKFEFSFNFDVFNKQ